VSAVRTDLGNVAEGVGWPDHEAEQAARELIGTQLSLGRLGQLGTWICGVQGRCPPADFQRARVVIFAGDHGVSAAGVTAHDPERTARVAAGIVAGSGTVNVFADIARAGVRLVDIAMDTGLPADPVRHKVRRSSGRIDREDALREDEQRTAVAAGIAVADEEIDGGADLLVTGHLGAGGSTAAAALVSVLTDTEPVKVVGRGSGIDDDTWMRKAAAVRDARRRGAPARADPDRLLAVAGAADLAALAGFVLRAAARRTPVLLDGLVTTAAALVAHEAAPRVMRWWLAGQLSPEPAHLIALRRLGLDPVLDLGITAGTGCGALAAVPLLRAAVRTLAGIAVSAAPSADV
jgi:nicotinate-nucleotide--dimethylbenzimidazole phosphoribosyltransferase